MQTGKLSGENGDCTCEIAQGSNKIISVSDPLSYTKYRLICFFSFAHYIECSFFALVEPPTSSKSKKALMMHLDMGENRG